MDRVLVAGGAGYIGSHACKALAQTGYTPVCFNNLLTGWQDAVTFGPFEQGDFLDRARIDEVLAKHKSIAIMHFAALFQIGESMDDPSLYWRTNVQGSLNLIETADVENFIFSSICATYVDQGNVVLDENSVQQPINAYGASKRTVENIL